MIDEMKDLVEELKNLEDMIDHIINKGDTDRERFCFVRGRLSSINNAIEKQWNSTKIKDRNGWEIMFGDTLRFADKVEWYRSEYWVKVAVGLMTKEEALKEIESKPYEERKIGSVQDYEWLLSSEIQSYWEVV